MAQLNNLLVTGDSRFLNTVHCDIDGNSETSTLASKLSTEQGTSAGARPVWYSYLGDNTRAVYHTSFTYNPSGGVLSATKFVGALQGNADTATSASKLGSSNVGSTTQPIYLNGGTATACTYTLGKSVPSDAVFTDTKVTSVGNHYAPTEDSSATLSADASSTTAATWNSTSLVTGVDIKRDAKGHVTGVAVDSIKMPINPNTDTHRPIKVNGGQILGNNTAPFNLVSGDNIHMTITGSGSVTIHSDQIDDSYTYSQYQDLPDSVKMQDKIFMVKDAPNPPSIPIVDEYAREQISERLKLHQIRAVATWNVGSSYTFTDEDWAKYTEFHVFIAHANTQNPSYYEIVFNKYFFSYSRIVGYGSSGGSCFVQMEGNGSLKRITLHSAVVNSATYNPLIGIYAR